MLLNNNNKCEMLFRILPKVSNKRRRKRKKSFKNIWLEVNRRSLLT